MSLPGSLVLDETKKAEYESGSVEPSLKKASLL